MKYKRVAIFGPGLLGGSLALALAEHDLTQEIAMWGRREEALAEVLLRRVAEYASTDACAVAKGADLIIFATPVEVMPELAQRIVSVTEPGALVTDVGSVKKCVVSALEPIFGPDRFIGSHPMAGSEKSGFAAAVPGLFENAACIVTPTERTAPSVQERAVELWRELGCRLFQLDAETHDRSVAAVSHLPHFIAAVLAVAAHAHGGSNALKLAGNGFRDCTRVALGSPPLWNGILAENRAAVLEAIETFQATLSTATDLLRKQEDLSSFLASGRNARAQAQAGVGEN